MAVADRIQKLPYKFFFEACRCLEDSVKILVVDDSSAFRQMLVGWLLKEGHDVCDADGGPEVLAILKEYDFDAITLDLVMGKANGLTLLSRIRELRPDIPAIVISAAADVRVAVEAIRAGAHTCMEKPLDFDHLRAELQGLEIQTQTTTQRPPLRIVQFSTLSEDHAFD